MKACPDEKFALVGYSQGGMIMTSAAPKLSAAAAEKVLAVVLYGAGDGSSVTAAIKKKVLANCAPGDFVSFSNIFSSGLTLLSCSANSACFQACTNSGSGPGHVSYNDEGTIWHDRAAKYIVAAFKGQPMGQKLMRSPTAQAL